ncbi:PhzF family phenazine biosynthesis isomerase [Streptomyces sp. NBC_00838]|uniref:PhzF family phenazine biosynthesis protein n=1 Tax=Streptomyces sp. NBC_00838 TaxID=2903680 RepID=UPI00386689ED|nr:PhzF family phenazine biosynthesis isomerase [Streptomyces sp. NBC_00838]
MDVLRYAAFTNNPEGGNPAGVVLDASGADATKMAAVASEVGYSETAFVEPRGQGHMNVRYFSPGTEVPFCGHATIATAVAHADRYGVGDLTFHTKAGTVPVSTTVATDGSVVATLVSVPPRTESITEAQLGDLLKVLGWSATDLDPALPPRVTYAGACHPVIAAAEESRLADLHYDMAELAELMDRHGWVTINMIRRESATVFHSRNAFPPGGVVEDPACGAAAAALGGYLRKLELIDLPATLTVLQGHHMGRPSTISVTIPQCMESGISVTGTAVPITHTPTELQLAQQLRSITEG